MEIWRWFVALVSRREAPSVPGDVRYHETQHRHEIDTAAANAERIVDSRINAGSHPTAP